MLILVMVVAASVSSGFQASRDHSGETQTPRLRGADATVKATIAEGCRRSPAFADLVDRIDRSELVVYVQQARALGNGMRGALLHGGAGPRYLRVLLQRGMSLDRRVAVLAHELQHVLEVIEAGIPTLPTELDALFRRIGEGRRLAGERQQYETAAALDVAAAVSADLRAKRDQPGLASGSCLAGDSR